MMEKQLGIYLIKLLIRKTKQRTSTRTLVNDNEGNIYREQDIPEGFNTFFSSVGQVLDRTIPKTEIDPMKYLNISESEECRNVPKVTEIFVETYKINQQCWGRN